MRLNIIRRLSSILLVSAFFLVVSGMAEIEVGRVFGFATNSLFAANKIAKKKVAKKAVKKSSKKRVKTVADDDYVLPQEWQWFNKPLKLGSIFTNPEEKKEEKASFAIALKKMEALKSKRSEKDEETLAKIKSDAKSPSMSKMAQKVREINRNPEIEKTSNSNNIIIGIPAVMPSFVSVPAPIKEKAENKKYQNVDKIKNEAKELKEEAVAKVKTEIAKSQKSVTPEITEADLNNVIAIDDDVAVDSEPPVIKGSIIVEAVDETIEQVQEEISKQNLVEEKIEKLYYGVGNKYSDRINQLVNERKSVVQVKKNNISEN